MIIIETLLSGWVISQKGYDINCGHYSQSIKLYALSGQLTCWGILLKAKYIQVHISSPS